MQSTLAKKWHALSAGTPGRRFRDRYYRNQDSAKKQHFGRRLVRFLLAAVAAAIGAVLTVIPGPAIPFFFLAGALVAADWLWMAKILDWLEVRLRRLFQRGQSVWHRLPPAGRVAVAALGAGLSAASTYGFYRLLN